MQDAATQANADTATGLPEPERGCSLATARGGRHSVSCGRKRNGSDALSS